MNIVDKLVSIVVPVYNAENYIEETIRMVENQTYFNWELILVDDGSKDDSRNLISKYLEKQARAENIDKIHLHSNLQNVGAAKTRNAGIAFAKGRYIAFLDADDVWTPNKLEVELRFMQDKSADFVFTAYEFGDADAKGTGRIVTVPETLNYRQALSRTIIFTSTVMFDTDKISKELMQMPEVASEDTATWWKILRNGYIAHGLNEVTAIYRRPASSLSSNKMKAMKRIWNLYRKEEKLSLFYSLQNFILWALRATLRRV